MEGILLDTMFDLPSLEGIEEVVISKEVVEGTARPLYIYADRAERAGDASAATDRGMSWQSAMPTVPVWLARHADRLRPFLIGTRCDWRGGRKTLAYYLPQQRWQAGR